MANHRLRKRLTYGTICFYYVCSGLEYAVIFPTIWAYLQSLGARDENLLGVAVAAFSVSSLVGSPLVGKWFDRTQNAKQILILLNLFEIAGGVLYFLAPNPWFVVLSRFICGIGGCAATAVMADVTQSSTLENRTAIMSNFQACRQIGLLVGPACNLALRELDFNIGRFPVDKLTSPGVFMALLGCIAELLFVTIYYNLGRNEAQQKLVESLRYDYDSIDGECHQHYHHYRPYLGGSLPSVNSEPESNFEGDVGQASLFGSGDVGFAGMDGGSDCSGDCRLCHTSRRDLVLSQSLGSDEMMEDAEKRMGVVCQNPNCRRARSVASGRNWVPDDYYVTFMSSYNADVVNTSEAENNFVGYRGLLNDFCDEFLRDEIVALLGLAFISFFAQTVLETIVTPLSQIFYNFGEFENSLLFLFAGLEIMISFLSINFLSRVMQDRTLILIGSLLMIFSLTWYLVFVPSFRQGDWTTLPWFSVGIFANLLGISLLIACCISLFSKMISKERQGVGHGIRRMMLSAGMILGPLWGGATTDMLVVLFSVPLALVVLFSILFCISYPKLHVRRRGDYTGEASFASSINHGSIPSQSFDYNQERRPFLSEVT